MNHKIIFPILFFAAVLMSCGSAKSSDEAGMAPNTEAPPPPPPPPTDKSAVVTDPIPEQTEQKLIKNGEVSFRVKNLGETKQKIQQVLTSFNGYIAKENSYGSTDNPSENLIIRIPNKNFDKFLEQVLIGVEEIDSKNIDIEDVTAQFVDIEARLKNKKQLEAKYQELLVKATNMEDILKIEKEISYIREDIEASEGRLKYLSSQVAYSTVSLHYYEKRSNGFNFGGKLGKALSNGGTGFLEFIIIMVNLWPLWLIGGSIWYIIVRIIRKSRKKKIQNVQ